MARRRSFPQRGLGSARRAPSTWSRTVSQVALTVPAGTKAIITSFTLNNPGIGETVRRTRGVMHMESDQVAAVENQLAAMGAVVISDLALAAGAASIPGPVTDSQDDGWFVWMPMLSSQSVATTFHANAIPWMFDSKAMRKVEEGFSIAFMVENASLVFGIRVYIAISMLTSIS